MTLPLNWLRYLIVITAAVAAPYTGSVASYPPYMAIVLLFLLLIRLREHDLSRRFTTLLTALEAAAACWLTLRYGGVLYFCFLSALISLFSRQDEAGSLRKPFALLLFVLMNAALYAEHAGSVLAANLIFITAAFLLFRSADTEIGRVELQELYDELRKKHYELEEARRQLIEYAHLVEGSAQTEERSRIARDLHDDLGHKLIRLKMMLEAVLHIMPAQPDKGLEMVRQVRDQLSESMEAMRKTVRQLKPGEDEVQSFSLDKLMEDLAREPGFRVRYRVHGMPFPLYPSCEIVLYRNAQEAVTNAIRHGGADEIQVDLHYDPGELLMTVKNNGSVPSDLSRRGLGLSGMEERTRVLGGSLELGAEDRFCVTTRIPLVRS